MSTNESGPVALLRRVAAFAAATAVAGGLMAGTASASNYRTDASRVSDQSVATTSDGSSTPAPPTANLANLNNNMRVVSKGVSAAVHFDPGLVSGNSSVAITVKWGSVAQTSGYYNNTYGSRFAFDFPANDGKQRWEVINVTFTERTGTATSTRRGTTATRTATYTYTAGRSVPIQGIWDVSLSALKFTLLNDCDWIGDSDIDLYFSHSAAYGHVGFGLSEGESHYVNEFAKTWYEVGTSADLRVPIVSFYEEDPTGARLIDDSQHLSDQRLLPGTTHHTSLVVHDDNGDQCQARVEWDTFIGVHTYSV